VPQPHPPQPTRQPTRRPARRAPGAIGGAGVRSLPLGLALACGGTAGPPPVEPEPGSGPALVRSSPAADTPDGAVPEEGTAGRAAPGAAPAADADAVAQAMRPCAAELACALSALRALPPPPGASPRADPRPALEARVAAARAGAHPALAGEPSAVAAIEAAAAEGFVWGLYLGRGAAPAIAARVDGPHAPLLRTAFAHEAARLLAEGRPPERAPAAIAAIHAGARPAPRGAAAAAAGCALPPPPPGAPTTPTPGGGARLRSDDPQTDRRIAAREGAAWAGAAARDLAPGLQDPSRDVAATAARLISALPQDPDQPALLDQIAAHPDPGVSALAAARPPARRCPG